MPVSAQHQPVLDVVSCITARHLVQATFRIARRIVGRRFKHASEGLSGGDILGIS